MIVENNSRKLLENKLVVLWLKNGIFSLGIAGLYSIILVILRTPQLSEFITNKELFKSALVVHVNLSVLVWLLSITAVIWSLKMREIYLGLICARLAIIGSIMISISPFFEQQAPVINNYIPMLENIIFIIGISLFGISMLLFAFNTLFNYSVLGEKNLLSIASSSSALMFILVWLCFTLSYLELQQVISLVPVDRDFFYELLYWSGGHLLQFVYTQSLLIVWLVLFETTLGRKLQFQKIYLYLLGLNLILASGILLGHLLYDLISEQFKHYYTLHMKYTGGIVPVAVLLLLTYEAFFPPIAIKRENQYAKSATQAAIICSSSLFLAGGLIGIFIASTNVAIPAHYHGSIVGISVGFMGLAYWLCKLDNSKRACQQLYILSIGQILHISGLAFAGGYGVLRKTTSMEIAAKAKLALGLMGGGGLIAIIGGLIFVVICGRNLFLKLSPINN